ncbi:hypothetical protein AB685_18875 [Bacillus sp. LL01]|nr:hypothetical protein AB685_18875 [Bacillus sp. LL01]
MLVAKGADSSGRVATLLRPRRLVEEAQGRPAESEAVCGEHPRCLAVPKHKKTHPSYKRRDEFIRGTTLIEKQT